MATCVLKISLSSDMAEEIERHKKLRHKQSIEETVLDLIRYALRLPQHFMKYDWKKAEDEADREISSGKTESFNTVDDFIADLKK
jgi:Arc/MetJ-type ribon-helix-helix transcriptional regulator